MLSRITGKLEYTLFSSRMAPQRSLRLLRKSLPPPLCKSTVIAFETVIEQKGRETGSVPIDLDRMETHIVARFWGRKLAEEAGFKPSDCMIIATLISDIARKV